MPQFIAVKFLEVSIHPLPASTKEKSEVMDVNPKIEGILPPKMDGENNGDRFLSGQFRPIFRCFCCQFQGV